MSHNESNCASLPLVLINYCIDIIYNMQDTKNEVTSCPVTIPMELHFSIKPAEIGSSFSKDMVKKLSAYLFL